jgi:HlyD family secretion protein
VDIARPPQKKRKKYVYIAIGVVGLLSVTIFLRRLEPAAPTVDRGTLWIDSVRKGTMLREVRAPGTLVPERIRLVSAVTAGRVEQIPIRPGTPVTPGTKILELSNPDVELQFLEAQRQLTAAEGERINLRTNLETQRLNQEGVVATIRNQHAEAKRALATIEALDAKKLSSANELATARERAAELEQRLAIEQKRLEIVTNTVERQLELQQANINRLRAIEAFQRDRVASMNVLAGEPGVLQEMSLELGQYVVPGQLLAKVAQPGRLKAVLRVPETQVKDIVLGQKVSIDTRNGIIPGHVMRIDPSVLNTTVAVEVALDSALPKGARADLSVDGTIEIERLENVMFINRPAYGQPESTVGIFKLLPDGKSAARVNVKLGRSSVNTIEVVQGLNIGDKVIVSDMSAWDSNERVKVKQ